jgi:UDP-GlcNAc:undecaprenyl-phosphate/decaprenyl-phosphate GlcNAc-1-phosphate transferase
VLRRTNYRGKPVAFPLGMVLLAASLVVVVALAAMERLTGAGLLQAGLGRWLVYLTGVALLGLVDDLLTGDDSPRGLRGHGRALLAGEVSTGQAKALGTLGLAAFAASTLGAHGAGYTVDVGVLALAPHVGNLLDLRPGRAEKAAALTAAAVCAINWTLAPLLLLGPFAGPVAVGSRYTLRERAMLGDSGAGVIGAMIGVLLVTSLPATALLLSLVVLIAISLYGEFRSISSSVERLPLLQRLDSLGRVN